MLCNKLVFSFMCEAFLFGKRIENFCYVRTVRFCCVHCIVPEDYSCLVDIIYVWFYHPVVHISQQMSSGDNLKFLPATRLSSPSNFLCFANNYSHLLNCIFLFLWCFPIGFLQLTTNNNSFKCYRIWCVSYSGIWHCATQYLVPDVLRHHGDLIFGGQNFQEDGPLCCLGTWETKFSVTFFISHMNLRIIRTAAET